MRHRYATKIVLGLVAVAIVASASAGYVAYRREIAAAYERIANASAIADTACGPIEYDSVGDGPAALIVHGAGGGFDQGMAFGAPLAVRGFRMIAMSRFGYLRTPLPRDASAAAQADAHACLLDWLRIDRVAIVGASAGAPSALQFALRHPQRTSALVLMVPALYVPRAGDAPAITASRATQLLFETALKSDFIFWLSTRLLRRTLIEAILATPNAVVERASAEEQQRVEKMLKQILPIAPRRNGLINDAAVTSTLPRYALERVTAPTLAVSVEDDLFGTYASARYTAEQIKGARFVGFKSGGHVWVGRDAEVYDALARFLSRAGDETQ